MLSGEVLKSISLLKPKKVVLSGPSGYLGSRVLTQLLNIHIIRQNLGLPTGEIVLLSASPGRLMARLYKQYGSDIMRTVRASRVDYYTQHDAQTWKDQLGSLGLEGECSVFVNLAAVAGPKVGVLDAMMDVNYFAPRAAATACHQLKFSHWIQSSTQATNAERGGQVPYSRAKAMIDYSLRLLANEHMAVSVACLGLLYSKADGNIGQEHSISGGINLIDLTLLPLTPIMGDGSAPLQPLEVEDAAQRIAYLALSEPADRPQQNAPHCKISSKSKLVKEEERQQIMELSGDAGQPSSSYRFYDAVGPETMSILEMLNNFAKFHGNRRFTPVHIGYRNMEKILNVKSLGNLNRQFVSLLRSEQDSAAPIIGDPSAWERLTFDPSGKLLRLEDAFAGNLVSKKGVHSYRRSRTFPYSKLFRWLWTNPGVIIPGAHLSFEILRSFFRGMLSGDPKGKSRKYME